MPVGHRAVGERIYVFSSDGGRQSASTCLIEAHGEQKLFGDGFRLAAGQRVVFYVEQGAAQAYHSGVVRFNEPGKGKFSYTNALQAIATGVATEESHVDGPGKCPDYNLEKIQKTNVGCMGGDWSNWIGSRNDMTYESVEKLIDYFRSSRDIITIRNRSFRQAVTLSELIAELRKAGYAYTEYHCSFCRVPQAPWQASAPARQVTGASRPGGGRY